MSTRLFSLIVLALVSASSMGCCMMPGGGCGMGACAPCCGMAEPDCCCPEPCCGCSDACCDTCCEPCCGCGDDCCEPCCGCGDDCCEPCCGCGDVGCGSCVGSCPILGNCCILKRLKKAFCGCGYYGGGCCGGCSSEHYWNEWQNDPPCNCHSSAKTGGHYGGAYGRRAFLAKQHQDLTEELRVADGQSGPILR